MGPADQQQPPALQRHFGLLHATALNVSMIVGAGVLMIIVACFQILMTIAVFMIWVRSADWVNRSIATPASCSGL